MTVVSNVVREIREKGSCAWIKPERRHRSASKRRHRVQENAPEHRESFPKKIVKAHYPSRDIRSKIRNTLI